LRKLVAVLRAVEPLAARLEARLREARPLMAVAQPRAAQPAQERERLVVPAPAAAANREAAWVATSAPHGASADSGAGMTWRRWWFRAKKRRFGCVPIANVGKRFERRDIVGVPARRSANQAALSITYLARSRLNRSPPTTAFVHWSGAMAQPLWKFGLPWRGVGAHVSARLLILPPCAVFIDFGWC